MKKLFSSIIFTLCAALALSACSGPTDAAASSEESVSEEASQTAQGVDLSPEYQLSTIQMENQAYPVLFHSMEALSRAGLLDKTWDTTDAQTFTPDQAIQYVLFFTPDPSEYFENGVYTIPADVADPLAEAAFSVNVDHLHTSSFYNAEAGTYTLPESPIPPRTFMITSPDYTRGQVIILWMDLVEGQSDVYHITGESYLRFTVDESETVFAFASCSYNEYHSSDSSGSDSSEPIDENGELTPADTPSVETAFEEVLSADAEPAA